MIRTLSVLVLTALTACGSEVMGPEGGGGEGAAAPIDPCAEHTTLEACCVEGCLWLKEREGFPGACFSEEFNCSGTGCGPGKLCFGTDLIGSTAECHPWYHLGGSGFGVCVDECPVLNATGQDFCYDSNNTP